MIGKKCVDFIRILSANSKQLSNAKLYEPVLDGLAPILAEDNYSIYIKSLVRELYSILIIEVASHSGKMKNFWL